MTDDFSTFIQDLNQKTTEAFLNPKVGDQFEEFSTFWLTIIKIDHTGILTCQRVGTVKLKFILYPTLREFQDAFLNKDGEGYSIYYFDNTDSQTLLNLYNSKRESVGLTPHL